MKNSTVFVGIGVLFVIVLVFVLVFMGRSSSDSAQNSIDNSSYSMSDIALHNSSEDCWFAIEGKVYDVTEYVKGGKHPGGDTVTLGCGKDATDLFTNKVDKGQNHSDKAWNFLETFYIGDLAN